MKLSWTVVSVYEFNNTLKNDKIYNNWKYWKTYVHYYYFFKIPVMF